MNGPQADISIILLTYNGADYLAEVLTSIFSQHTSFSFEVLAIDSGSSDRTVELLRQHQVRLHQIPNREFGHGKTRNLGVRLTSGRYLVFLTQDATPAHERWLDNLVQPLAADPRVAGTYSRQIPRADCNPLEWRDIERGAGPIRLVKKVDCEDAFQKTLYVTRLQDFIAFSNVSSSMRREVLERLPFNESITMVEDQEWCRTVLESGYTVIYEATSAVYHSHNFPLPKVYQRHFDYGASYKEFAPLSLTMKDVLFYTFFESFCDVAFIVAQRGPVLWTSQWVLKAPCIRFAMRYGLYKGLQANSSGRHPTRLEVATTSHQARTT